MRRFFLCLIYAFAFSIGVSAQDHSHNHDNHSHGHSHQGSSHNHSHDHSNHNHSHDHSGHNHNHDHSGHNHSHDHKHGAHGHDHHGHHAGCGIKHKEFNAGDLAIHHIADANVYSIGPLQLPLPCILYNKELGWKTFMSSKFGIGHHGDGHHAIDGYVLDGGSVKRVKAGQGFPMGELTVNGFNHTEDKEGKFLSQVCYDNKLYDLEPKSTADGGIFGGGITSFYDFSLTKNVVSMILVCFLLGWLFFYCAKQYRNRDGKAPTGVQNLMEVFVTFIRDEVAKPFLGHKWAKFFPFLLCIFFFIVGLNLFGQIPFFGGANATGNLAVTMVLALFAFIITNINGNAHYWKHQLFAPGTPWFVKPILIPVEILGLFIKPLTLMLRLFANITAGHMVIIIFVSFIFIFGKVGTNPAGAYGAAIGSTLLTMFMMAIELIVAFVQAFVFTILTASYIGAAVEEEHH